MSAATFVRAWLFTAAGPVLLSAGGCVFGLTTAPPRAYRAGFILTTDRAITNECVLTPGILGGERRGLCLYLDPRCHDCGQHVAKGAPLTILRIHHGPDTETATIMLGSGADAVVVDRVNWNDLKQVIVPVAREGGGP